MNNKKTHCLRGHRRTPENLLSNGVSLYCKVCAKVNEKQLRRNARKRGFEFFLTKADFEPLPTHCPVLGVELDYSGSGKPNRPALTARIPVRAMSHGTLSL